MGENEKTQALLNFVLGDLFNATLRKDIVKYNERAGCFTIANEVLSPKATQELIDGARVLKELSFFKYLCDDLEYDAKHRMYEKVNVIEDANFGRAIIYILDIMRKKVVEVSQMELKNKPVEKEPKAK